MLSHFRINDPYRLLSLFILLVILYLPFFIGGRPLTYPDLHEQIVGEKVREGWQMYTHIADDTPLLSAWFNGACMWAFGHSGTARYIVAFVILVLQSAFVGTMFINRKAFPESTYVPALIYSLLAVFSFDMASLSGHLVASVLVLLSLDNLLKEIESQKQRDENIMNIGVWIGLASLFSFSFLIYLPGCSLILLLFTRLTPRKHLLMLFGFLLPHLVLSGYYIMNGAWSRLWDLMYVPNLKFQTERFWQPVALAWIAAIPVAYFLLSVLFLNRVARVTKYQSQLIQVMFLWLTLSILQILFGDGVRPQALITVLPSMSFFITYFLILIRRRRFAESHLWILIASAISLSYLSLHGGIPAIAYDQAEVRPVKAPVSGERVLVLADRPEFFLNNKPASGFINWRISESVFRNPSNYKNIIWVYQSISRDPPDVIIDPSGLFAGFLPRLPTVERAYREEAAGLYVRRKP